MPIPKVLRKVFQVFTKSSEINIMNISLRLLGDGLTYGDLPSSSSALSLLLQVTTASPSTSQIETFPLVLINSGFGVLRSLFLASSPSLFFPSTIICNGSSLLETAEIIPLLSKLSHDDGDELQSGRQSSFYQKVVKNHRVDADDNFVGSSSFGTKVTLVFSSESVWNRIKSRLEHELLEEVDDASAENVEVIKENEVLKKFLSQHVEVVILETNHHVDTDSSTNLIFKSIIRSTSFQISSVLSVAASFMNGLRFSLCYGRESLPLLSVSPISASNHFDASKFLRQQQQSESLPCIFSFVPIQNELMLQHFGDFCRTLENVSEDKSFHEAFDDEKVHLSVSEKTTTFRNTRFILSGRNVLSMMTAKNIEFKNYILLLPSSTKVIGNNRTNNNDNAQDVSSIFNGEIRLFSTIVTETAKQIEASPAPQPVVSPTKKSKNKQPKVQSEKRNSISKSPPAKKPPATLLPSSANTSAMTVVNQEKETTTSKDQKQTPSASATMLPETPDLSVIGNLSDQLQLQLQQQQEQNQQLPTTSKSNVRNSVSKSPKNKSGDEKDNNSNTSVSNMLEEMGESPTMRNHTASTKSTQTPPRPTRNENNNNDDDDDGHIDPNSRILNSRSRSRTNNNKSNQNNTSAKSTPNKSNRRNSTDAFLQDYLVSSFLENNQSRREILQQQQSLLVDAPTKAAISARVFVFSNEDKAKPGKMIMLRSVRTIEQLKQKVSEMFAELKPVGDLFFAETGEMVKSVKDIVAPDQEVVAVMHGGLSYEPRLDPPRLMKCYAQLVPSETNAKWVALCRNL